MASDIADDFAAYPWDPGWLLATPTCARVIARLDEGDAAATLLDRLAPWADQVNWAGQAGHGPVGIILGRLATTLGRYQQAEAYFAKGAALSEGLRSPLFAGGEPIRVGRVAPHP